MMTPELSERHSYLIISTVTPVLGAWFIGQSGQVK